MLPILWMSTFSIKNLARDFSLTWRL